MPSGMGQGPEIILGWGAADHEPVRTELLDHTYQDLSTVIVMPTRGLVPARVVDSFMSLMRPPNAKTTQLIISRMEVGAAYQQAVEIILGHPALSNWRFMLTLEEDNLVPPDALLRLQREMIVGGFDVLGALYWTKGADGLPQIWGDPNDPEPNFRPQRPTDGIVECRGTGMGCTLFDLDVFRTKVPGPWFETVADVERGAFTQDLWFFHRAQQHADLKVGVDCRVKVGHLDYESGVVW